MIGLLRASSGDHQLQKGYCYVEDGEDRRERKTVEVDGAKLDGELILRRRRVEVMKEAPLLLEC